MAEYFPYSTFRFKAMHRLGKALSLPTLIILALGFPAMAGYADCKTDYDATLKILDDQVQQADGQKHPNPDTFEKTFQTSIDQLQAQNCLPELMNLIQHIRSEQQKHPIASPPANQKPIVD